MKRFTATILSLLLAAPLFAQTTTDDHEKAKTGAALGAAAGAIVGAVIGTTADITAPNAARWSERSRAARPARSSAR